MTARDPADRDARRAIGILGGTFDPVHAGHLALADEARMVLDLDRVLFVPNSLPPHKRDQIVTSASHREAMIHLAIDGSPAYVLSRLELQRPGPSYAVDTVTEVAAQSRAEGRPEPWFVLSAEALRDFPTWRQPLRILEACRIAVAPREGSEDIDATWLAEQFSEHVARFRFLPGPELDIASTTIRERVASGLPIGGLVPPAVERYIIETGLYRGRSGHGGLEGTTSVEEEQGTMMSGGGSTVGGGVVPRRARRPGLPARRSTDEPEALPPGAEAGPVDEATLALAHRVVELASDKKASDIVLLDVRGQTTMTDYFVICSGASDRQLGAIADGITEGLEEDGSPPLSREGEASSHWVLLDFGGVIVHVMSVPERDFYQLERLWSRASLLLHVV